jgi:hypothetical protein
MGGACAGVNPQAHPSSELRVREIGFLSGVFFFEIGAKAPFIQLIKMEFTRNYSLHTGLLDNYVF